MSLPKTLAIIPALNEQRTIANIVSETVEYVDEVLVVNDGSQDDTAGAAREVGATVISHPASKGIGETLMTGYRYALIGGAEVVVQLDGDGQHDPRYVPDLVVEILNGSDLVVASRFLSRLTHEPIAWRKAGIRLYSALASAISGHHVTDVTSGFRALRSEIIPAISPLPSRHWAIYQTCVSISKGLKYAEVPTRMRRRVYGSSQFTLDSVALYHLRVLKSLIPVLFARHDETHENSNHTKLPP